MLSTVLRCEEDDHDNLLDLSPIVIVVVLMASL